MKLVLIVVITTIVLFLTIYTGSYLSYYITDNTEYILFWLMYLLSVITLCNIGGGIYYYTTLKNKTGPRGPRGIKGEDGDAGNTGKCDVSCRNNACQLSIQQHIIDTINTLDTLDTLNTLDTIDTLDALDALDTVSLAHAGMSDVVGNACQ